MRGYARAKKSADESENLCRHVGRRLRARRKAAGFSQARLAALTGLSPQQIQKYESGASQIFLERLLQFAQVLSVAPEYFYHGFDFSCIGAAIDSDVIDRSAARAVDILFVDQNPGDILAFERALGSFRDRVRLHGMADPALALRRARDAAEATALVLLDISLPQNGGLRMMRGLKDDPRTAHIPVVVFTHSASRKAMVDAYRSGAAGFILKSPQAEVFAETARHFLSYWLQAAALP